MAGTTISTTGTVGIQILQASQNPVLVTTTGTISTTGASAINDAVTAASSDIITNQGKLLGQNGVAVQGASGGVFNQGVIVGTNGDGVVTSGNATINNGGFDNTAASLAGTFAAILIGGATPGASSITNFGKIAGNGDGIDDLNAGPVKIVNEASTGSITGSQAIVTYGLLTLFNDGTISGGGGLTLNAGGTVINGSLNGINFTNPQAIISGGVSIGGANASALTNFATIQGNLLFRNSGGAILTNLGTITGSAALPANGIVVNGSSTDTTASISGKVTDGQAVTNFGTVSGGMLLGGSLTNGSNSDTTALIVGGVGFGGGTGADFVTNYGTITGGVATSGFQTLTVINGSPADAKAVITTATGDAIGTPRVTVLINFGSVFGGNDALDVGGGSSVTNGSTADTTASIAGGSGIVAAGSGNTVNNFGSITALYGDAIRTTGNVTNGSTGDTKALLSGGSSGWGVTLGSGNVLNYGTIIGPVGGVGLGAGSVTNLGLIEGSSDGGIQARGAAIVNSGTIASLSGATGVAAYLTAVTSFVQNAGAVITGSLIGTVGTVVNNGTITLSNGFEPGLDVTSGVDPSSSGVFQLNNRSALEVAAALGTKLAIRFMGTAHANGLTIDNAAKFGQNVGSASYAGPLLEGFSAGDEIDLKNVPITGVSSLAYTPATGDLQVISGGKSVATLQFQNSSLGAGTFHASSDGYGNTLITHS